MKKLIPIVSKIIEIRTQSREAQEDPMVDGKSEESGNHKKVQWRDESDSDSSDDEEEEEEHCNSPHFSWETQAVRKESKASRRMPSKTALHFSAKIFTSFKGTGLYPLICKINHSCVPSLSVEYINGDASGKTIIRVDSF